MNRLPLSVSRCRHILFPRLLVEAKPLVRTRTASASSSKPPRKSGKTFAARSSRPQPQHSDRNNDAAKPLEPVVFPIEQSSLQPDGVTDYLTQYVYPWRSSPTTLARLQRFGIPRVDASVLLKQFTAQLRQDMVFELLEYNAEYMERLAYDLSDCPDSEIVDETLSRLFFEWASHPSVQRTFGATSADKAEVTPSTLITIRSLFGAADFSHPADNFPRTRSIAPRKVIMHVGPTNSGKTHNALRALAAAPRGVYAGPLRLLAHEIWERLNKGQIVPLGVDPDADSVPDEDVDDASEGGKPILLKEGSSKYSRACNMITGEEQKIVEDGAGLVSMTVEMFSTTIQYDVGVIDEIQMISDPERGGSWASAVLGLNARELHLCGEETAVPLIQRLLKDTGDELIVNKYERLSPLVVAEEGLGGALSEIQKGDCCVTFSRRNIFALKKRIEQATGMRCAVAYGRLPPEIRSEQAALFNNPTSGYDVIIGSDAIGMGLNLRIKRIIFEAVTKWNGSERIPLSISQAKQIAGRAGRYGLHGDALGGVVTTLVDEDLPILRETLSKPVPLIKYARISPTKETTSLVRQALPANATSVTCLEVFKYVAKLHPAFKLQDLTKNLDAMERMDRATQNLPMRDLAVLQLAPIAWSDEICVTAVGQFLRMFNHDMSVKLRVALKTSGLLAVLADVQKIYDSKKKPTDGNLAALESLHKTLIVYIWLGYRNPIVFADLQEANALKEKTKELMDWCLKQLTRKTLAPSKPRIGRKVYQIQTKGKKTNRPASVPNVSMAATARTANMRFRKEQRA